MNLVIARARFCAGIAGLIVWVILLMMVGCQKPNVTSLEQMAEFEKAGPIRPEVDLERLVKARAPQYPYTVEVGDVLELYMPAVLQMVEVGDLQSLDQVQSYLCRVAPGGTITLPVVGSIPVADKNLAEIESAIINAYYPKYVVEPPSVIARISEYHTYSVSVVGAVKEPGVYTLNSNERSLVALLMKAGGVIDDGAGVIRIRRALDSPETEPVVLPVKGLNIPFADMALNQGDIVEVERLDPEVFTVIGLVNRPGTFPYLPGSEYSVMQALAFGGGVNDVANPKYVRVYRQKDDGTVIDATFKVNGVGSTDAANVKIRPGDVISVERTVATDTRMLFAQIFRVTFNFGGGTTIWD